MFKSLLGAYVYLHEVFHKRMISRFGCAAYGLHPKEVFGSRHDFFWMYAGKDDIVLDIACGTGNILYMIKDRIKRGYGIDISQGQIDLCRKYHSADNLIFQRIDITAIDYEQAKKDTGYNVAIFSHILEHIEDVPGLLRKVDAEKILICVPSREHWYRRMMEGLGLDVRTDGGHFREYDVQTLLDELDRAEYSPRCAGYNSDGDIVCYAMKNKSKVKENANG